MAASIKCEPVKLPSGIRLRHSPNALEKGIETIKTEVGEGSAVNKIVKVARRVLNVLKIALEPFEKGLPAISYLGFFNKVFSAFSSISSFLALAEHSAKEMPDDPKKARFAQVDRILNIASATLGIANGCVASLEILEAVGVLTISTITKAMGAIPVIGVTAAALFPLTPVSLAIDAAQSAVSVGIAAHKMHYIRKQAHHISDKQREWAEITPLMAKKRLLHLEEKKQSDLTRASEIQQKRDKTSSKALERVRVFELKHSELNQAQGFAKIPAKIRQLIAKYKLSWALSSDEKLRSQLAGLKNHCEKIEQSEEQWKIIKKRFKQNDMDPKQLEQLKTEKLSKWNIKKVNINWDKVKEGLTIALSSIVVITMIASIILFYSGIGTMPAMLTIASVVLLTTALGLGLYFFKKYKKPKDVPSCQKIDFKNTQLTQTETA